MSKAHKNTNQPTEYSTMTELINEHSYSKISKLGKNKRLSASPDYHNSFRNGAETNGSAIYNKVPYFTTHGKSTHDDVKVKKAAKRKSLNVVHNAIREQLHHHNSSRPQSKKRLGYHNKSASPGRLLSTNQDSSKGVPSTYPKTAGCEDTKANKKGFKKYYNKDNMPESRVTKGIYKSCRNYLVKSLTVLYFTINFIQ